LLTGLLTSAQAKCRAPSDESLRNEGAIVPYTRRIAIDQNPDFEEGDHVGRLDGYFDFEKGAILYLHPPSRDPAYQPPTKNYLKDIADTSPYPLVVKQDAAGVYREVPHMVVARFAMSDEDFLMDSNHAPVVELFTMCCDVDRHRFHQRTHIKQVGGEMKLLAGVTVQDWSQISWDSDLFLTAAAAPATQLQRRWATIAMHCFERVKGFVDPDNFAAFLNAN
jgi:hypothetical protein